jgi:hypothetical protein
MGPDGVVDELTNGLLEVLLLPRQVQIHGLSLRAIDVHRQ